MISTAMAAFLRQYSLRPVEAAWPKPGTPENTLAQQAQAKGLLSAAPVRKDWCRFSATQAGLDAITEFDRMPRGRR